MLANVSEVNTELTIQQLALQFEHYCVEKLNSEEIKYIHWSKVPHDILKECGYIQEIC